MDGQSETVTLAILIKLEVVGYLTRLYIKIEITSQQRTEVSLPMCPLFRGLTHNTKDGVCEMVLLL